MGVLKSKLSGRNSREFGQQLLAKVNLQGGFGEDDYKLAKEAWDCYDEDGNGVLDLKEAENFITDIVEVIKNRSQMAKGQAKKLIKANLKTISKLAPDGLKFEDFFGEKFNLNLSAVKEKKIKDCDYVEIFGLTDLTNYNGLRGKMLGIDSTGRGKVSISWKSKTRIILVKPENLRAAKTPTYAIRFTGIRGEAKSISLNRIEFYFVSPFHVLDKKVGQAVVYNDKKVFHPIRVTNPGGWRNSSQNAQKVNTLAWKLSHAAAGDWRDFSWSKSHSSTLVLEFEKAVGPLHSFRFYTNSDNKWRDPVAWNLYRIDQDTGDWKEIPLGYLNKSSISQGRKCGYPLRNVYKHTGMGQKAKDMEAIIEETKKKMENEEIALALPNTVPPLAKQVSFEPVTESTTWELVNLQRQKSEDSQKEGNRIVTELTSNYADGEILFLRYNNKDIYLPRIFPKEVMALGLKSLVAIAEYAGLTLSKWNTNKKGVQYFSTVSKLIAETKTSSAVKKAIASMHTKLKLLLQHNATNGIRDEVFDAASSFLQLKVMLKALDVQYEALTGMPADSNQLETMKAVRKKIREDKKKEIEYKSKERALEELGEVDIILLQSEKPKLKTYTGYSNINAGGNNGGTGYGGQAGIDAESRKAMEDKKAQQLVSDNLSTVLLDSLFIVMAGIKKLNMTGPKYHEAVCASGLNSFLAHYLRSSFMQISERNVLYLSIFKICEAVALGLGGVGMLLGEAKDDAKRASNRTNIVKLLDSIKRQVSVYTKQVSSVQSDAQMVKIASFAAEVDRIISSVFGAWKAELKVRKSKAKASGSDSKQDAKSTDNKSSMQKHIDRLQSLSVGMEDLRNSMVPHVFRKKFDVAHPNPNVMKRLTQEVASMMTGLPWGIFLRVDNTRMDVMRACIVAPGDAPYENGVFFFDLFVPDQYPSVPPLCKIITTNHGTVRFNPNLYSNGKVCLSLLGTWSGPGWDPAYSNILQVLLSIQSMILGAPEPVVNEPSWGSYRNTERSFAYNADLHCNTIAFAMDSHLLNIKNAENLASEMQVEMDRRAKVRKRNPGPPAEKASTNKKGPIVLKKKKKMVKPKAKEVEYPWESCLDEKANRFYYWNVETGQSQWKKPKKRMEAKSSLPKSPLEGFTEVLATHFWIKRDYLLKEQLPKWEEYSGKHKPKDPYNSSTTNNSDNAKRKKLFESIRKQLKEMDEPEMEVEDPEEEEESDDDDF
ncbi:hypothetical protein AAMO2058_000612100 [Amorphochlora amoebiformis]